MAVKKQTARKDAQRRKRVRFWGWVLGLSAIAAVCLLITLGDSMSHPILPTWDELFQAAGLREAGPLDSQMQVHILDVGNADAILVQNKGEHLLIDAGEKGDGDAVVRYLQAKGVKQLDMVIATHADADHIGGMRTVIDAFDIRMFLMAPMPEGHTPTTKAYTNMLEGLAAKGIKITAAKPGGQYAVGDAAVDILGPAAEFEDNNNQSVICKVTFGAKRFLFMGDAEKEAEDALLRTKADLRADVLKLGHHGSDTSTQAKLLDAVKPQAACITCGAGNAYGHPSASTLNALRKRQIPYYRSDLNGTVVASTDGTAITFQTEKEAS